MNQEDFESAIQNLHFFPISLSRDFFQRIQPILPLPIAGVQPNDFVATVSLLFGATLACRNSELLDLALNLKAILRDNSLSLPPVSKRSLISGIQLIEYASTCETNEDRGQFLGKLAICLLDQSDFVYNLTCLRQALIEAQAGSVGLQHYYSHMRLTSSRYFSITQEGVDLFGSLSAVEDGAFRHGLDGAIYSTSDVSLYFNGISETVRHALDASLGAGARSSRIVQVISPGRSGTYFLRTQLLIHACGTIPIHNIYSVPSLAARSLLSMLQFTALSDETQFLHVNSSQLATLADILSRHLIVFCTELLAYASRFNRLPIIVNHWWAPFAYLLKSILPNLHFLSITRRRDALLTSYVDKMQVGSNPMPPELFFSDFDPSSDDKGSLLKWSTYYLRFVSQLQMSLARDFPSCYSGDFCLTPPTEESAAALIELFDMNCSVDELMNKSVVNHKQTF